VVVSLISTNLSVKVQKSLRYKRRVVGIDPSVKVVEVSYLGWNSSNWIGGLIKDVVDVYDRLEVGPEVLLRPQVLFFFLSLSSALNRFLSTFSLIRFLMKIRGAVEEYSTCSSATSWSLPIMGEAKNLFGALKLTCRYRHVRFLTTSND